nr:MAG TPA: hypothetical protein [Microviridae sp.]
MEPYFILELIYKNRHTLPTQHWQRSLWWFSHSNL